MGALGTHDGILGPRNCPGWGLWDRKAFPEKARLTPKQFSKKHSVFFHTETIKALKQGFGTKLKRVLSQPHIYGCFIGTRALCGSRLPASRRPRGGPSILAAARVNYGNLFWPRILRNRLFPLSSVSAAPCSTPCAHGLSPLPPPHRAPSPLPLPHTEASPRDRTLGWGRRVPPGARVTGSHKEALRGRTSGWREFCRIMVQAARGEVHIHGPGGGRRGQGGKCGHLGDRSSPERVGMAEQGQPIAGPCCRPSQGDSRWAPSSSWVTASQPWRVQDKRSQGSGLEGWG